MERILFFDGTCAMCNGLVNFVLRHDKKGLFKFAPLQGQTATKYLSRDLRSDLNTAVLLDENGIHTQSDAIINVLIPLGSIFRLAAIAKAFPKRFRDFIYGFIAKNRYRWFGQTESCALISKQDRARIYD